jgi:hypothetical protein
MTALFWVSAPCRLAWVSQRFRGLYCLHHQGDEKSLQTHTRLHGTTTQKTAIFILTAMRNTNPTYVACHNSIQRYISIIDLLCHHCVHFPDKALNKFNLYFLQPIAHAFIRILYFVTSCTATPASNSLPRGRLDPAAGRGSQAASHFSAAGTAVLHCLWQEHRRSVVRHQVRST